MVSILIEDFINKKFQEIRDLSEERELHIRSNINVLNEVKLKYTVYFSGVNNSITDLESRGYKNDNAMYDRAINEYNNTKIIAGDLLKTWIK
jgi:hypothetical protein